VTAAGPRLAVAVSARLQGGDLPQVGLLLLAALVVALGLAWPGRVGSANEAWYAVAQTRAALLALLALGYGLGLPLEGPRRAAATTVAVLVVALSTLPLELVAHLGSAPATPAWWAWVVTPVGVAGQLALGAALGPLIRRLRLVAVAPLLVPAALVGVVALDVRLGITLLNPLTAALQVAPGYLATHAAIALTGLAVAARAARRGWSAP